MVNIEITGANRLAAVTEEGALFGKPLESAKAAAREIVDARVQTVEAALPGRVEAVVTEKLPAAVQAATGSEITRQIDERVTPTIESKVSSVIADKTAGIKTEILSSVTTEIDSKVEAGKTAAVTEAKSAIPAVVDSAVHEAISKIDIGEKDFGFTGRDIAATSYWHPDFWNENTQKGSEWRKLLNTGSSLGIVVLDKASGEWGDAVDENFLKQGMLAEAAGAKWCAFYLSSRFGAMAEEADAAYREEVRKNLNVTMDKVERATFDRIVQQAKNIISWYKGPDKIRKVAIFVDEAVHGWSEGQKKVVPWYKRLYLRLKQELGEDVLIIINPGANTVPEMMEACDVAITYESSASKYIDPETKFIHPDHYKTMPAWRFWHVIHGVTKDNIDAVFATAEKFNIGHLYATDQKFSVGTGSEDEPEENPYDYAPSDWVIQDTKSWVKGVLPFEQRVSALETVRTVPAGGTYNLSEGQSIGGFFLAGAVTHPTGVQWQTPNSMAPSTGLVILIRANDTIYGYAPGMTSAPVPQPAPPAPEAAALAAPANIRVAQVEGGFTVSWDTVAGATSYEISVDGATPVEATAPHKVVAAAGKTGVLQLRAKKGSTVSEWAQQRYMVAEVPASGKPVKWVFTWAHAGWAEAGKVLKNFFYTPKLDSTQTGQATAYERAVSSVDGTALAEPNNVRIGTQYLATNEGFMSKDGDRLTLTYTGEMPRIEDAPAANSAWQYTLEVEKHALLTKPAAAGEGRVYALAAGFAYDERWVNQPNLGQTQQPVKADDKGIEIRREDGIVIMSVIRANGDKDRIHWFAANGTIKPSTRLNVHGWRWGTLTGTEFKAA